VCVCACVRCVCFFPVCALVVCVCVCGRGEESGEERLKVRKAVAGGVCRMGN